MNLYLLTRKDDAGWGEAEGFVVRARSAREARKIASGFSGYEGRHIWTSAEKSECVSLDSEGTPGVVLRSFVHG